MKKLSLILVVLVVQIKISLSDEVKLSLTSSDSEDNLTFVATKEWQEIKPGQKVPQGLHYRMNLQTKLVEAKLLDPDESSDPKKSTSLTKTADDDGDETTNDDGENSRKRLEDALKNIPSENFDDVTEEKWKEISKKFKTYEEIKKDLKDIDLSAKTEAEVINHLMSEFHNSSDGRLEILKDLEYLMHSIDNSLLFISNGGVEKILIPNLVNQSDVSIRITLFKMLGAITQNNLQAKSYISEKTNLANDVINLMTKIDNSEELSSSLYSIGSLVRSNKLVSFDVIKKLMNILIEIITKESASLAIKTKTLLLIDDLTHDTQYDIKSYLNSLKFCHHIANFFELHRNNFMIDVELIEKCASSLLNFEMCKNHWAEHPMMRHTLLVILNSYKSRLSDANCDEDMKFIFNLIVEHLENLNAVLYGDLKISDDDLSERYKNEKDEL